MSKLKRYDKMTTEALIDSEMEFYKDLEEEENKKDIEESPAEVETNGPKTKNGVIANSLCVKVRKEPDFKSDVLEVLRKGDKVIILGKEKGFYIIQTSINKKAYISLDFVEEE